MLEEPVIEPVEALGEEVFLTTEEMRVAAVVGVERIIQSKMMGLGDHRTGAISSWEKDIEGAMGEMAYAKYHKKYWDGMFRFVWVPENRWWIDLKKEGRGDVDGQEIRTTSPYNRLIVRDHDKDDRRYWLVVGGYGAYRIVGWMLGGDAKNEKYKTFHGNDRPPAYFVPPRDLNPPDGVNSGVWCLHTEATTEEKSEMKQLSFL